MHQKLFVGLLIRPDSLWEFTAIHRPSNWIGEGLSAKADGEEESKASRGGKAEKRQEMGKKGKEEKDEEKRVG